jgi:hypothetical protein
MFRNPKCVIEPAIFVSAAEFYGETFVSSLSLLLYVSANIGNTLMSPSETSDALPHKIDDTENKTLRSNSGMLLYCRVHRSTRRMYRFLHIIQAQKAS